MEQSSIKDCLEQFEALRKLYPIELHIGTDGKLRYSGKANFSIQWNELTTSGMRLWYNEVSQLMVDVTKMSHTRCFKNEHGNKISALGSPNLSLVIVTKV